MTSSQEKLLLLLTLLDQQSTIRFLKTVNNRQKNQIRRLKRDLASSRNKNYRLRKMNTREKMPETAEKEKREKSTPKSVFLGNATPKRKKA